MYSVGEFIQSVMGSKIFNKSIWLHTDASKNYWIQSNLNSLNTDGLFTMAFELIFESLQNSSDSSWTQILRKLFLFYHEIVCCVYSFYYVENQKDFPKLSLFASWPGTMIKPQWLKLLIYLEQISMVPKMFDIMKTGLYNFDPP